MNYLKNDHKLFNKKTDDKRENKSFGLWGMSKNYLATNIIQMKIYEHPKGSGYMLPKGSGLLKNGNW